MRRMLRVAPVLLCVLGLAYPLSIYAQETRAVSGLVVDAESGAPVSDARITIEGTGRSVVTDPEGRFEVSGIPLGSLHLVLRHVAYGEHRQPLEVEASGSLHFQISVTSRAIELAPLGVEVLSREARDQRASGTATNIIDRAAIMASPLGQGLLPVLESRIPSLRVEDSCVEYRNFRFSTIPDPNSERRLVIPCRDITVYLDGVPDTRGSSLLAQLSPNDVERIEVLSGAEAGLRYMNGSRGVILVETRNGVVTESTPRIHVTGFGWQEPQTYPWLRVVGVSALTNAAVAGLASRTVFDCGDLNPDSQRPARCYSVAGVFGAALTSAIGGAISRRAGRTAFSEGRTYPALLMGAAAASIGYMLYVHGEYHDSDSYRATGQIVLAVGVPLSLTFSDRVFRMLR